MVPKECKHSNLVFLEISTVVDFELVILVSSMLGKSRMTVCYVREQYKAEVTAKVLIKATKGG